VGGENDNFQFSMFNFQINFNNSIGKQFFLLWALMVLWIVGPWPADASEKIDNYEVNVAINEDASVDVEEHISYDFGADERHGIYRTIPYKYRARGGNYKLEISDIKVASPEGRIYQSKTSRGGGHVKIKIGDPDKTITGQHTYVINYKVTGAINFFDNHDELYWNATGDKWEVAMQNVQSGVFLPQVVDRDQVQIQCYAGPAGSSGSCDDSFYSSDGSGLSKALFAQDKLEPGEGLTIVVGVPKGLIREPTWQDKLMKIVRDNWIVVLPLITLGILSHLWRTRGRDPAGRGAVPAQYDPPEGLAPSQVGTIIDEKADQTDLSADIVHLAINGYLKIKRTEEKKFLSKKIDYELIKLKDEGGRMSEPERLLFKKLFKDNKQSVKVSGLKNEFYKDWGKVKELVYKSVVKQGYFPRSPSTVRTIYAVVGLVVIGALGGFLAAVFIGLIGIISVIISGVMVVIFSFAMPVRTKKGVLMKEYILGMKRYISIAEKERIKFHNAPEKSPEHFDSLLPFAMVLGVEKQWAKQFKDIYTQQPSWYEGPAGSHFNAAILASSMGDFSSTAQSTLSSRPSSAASGGSGFSGGGAGGGFGGGGGGSW